MPDYVNEMKEKILGRGNKNIKNSEPRKGKQTNKQTKKSKNKKTQLGLLKEITKLQCN